MSDISTTEKRNQYTLEKFQQAWIAGDVDSLCTLMTEDAVYHSSIGPKPGQAWRGREELRDGFTAMLATDIGEVIDRGSVFHQNSAMARWEYRPAVGPSQLGCDYFEFEKGKISLKDAYRKILRPELKSTKEKSPLLQAQQSVDDITIREFQFEDVPQLLQLMKGLAVFEGYIEDFKVKEEDIINAGLFENPSFRAFIAVTNSGELTAMAVTYVVPWTYDIKPTLVMKELYVKPEWRGKKLGERLLGTVYAFANQIGASRIQWTVLKTNEKAQRFYKKNGGMGDDVWELWGKKS